MNSTKNIAVIGGIFLIAALSVITIFNINSPRNSTENITVGNQGDNNIQLQEQLVSLNNSVKITRPSNAPLEKSEPTIEENNAELVLITSKVDLEEATSEYVDSNDNPYNVSDVSVSGCPEDKPVPCGNTAANSCAAATGCFSYQELGSRTCNDLFDELCGGGNGRCAENGASSPNDAGCCSGRRCDNGRCVDASAVCLKAGDGSGQLSNHAECVSSADCRSGYCKPGSPARCADQPTGGGTGTGGGGTGTGGGGTGTGDGGEELITCCTFGRTEQKSLSDCATNGGYFGACETKTFRYDTSSNKCLASNSATDSWEECREKVKPSCASCGNQTGEAKNNCLRTCFGNLTPEERNTNCGGDEQRWCSDDGSLCDPGHTINPDGTRTCIRIGGPNDPENANNNSNCGGAGQRWCSDEGSLCDEGHVVNPDGSRTCIRLGSSEDPGNANNNANCGGAGQGWCSDAGSLCDDGHVVNPNGSRTCIRLGSSEDPDNANNNPNCGGQEQRFCSDAGSICDDGHVANPNGLRTCIRLGSRLDPDNANNNRDCGGPGQPWCSDAGSLCDDGNVVNPDGSRNCVRQITAGVRRVAVEITEEVNEGVQGLRVIAAAVNDVDLRAEVEGAVEDARNGVGVLVGQGQEWLEQRRQRAQQSLCTSTTHAHPSGGQYCQVVAGREIDNGYYYDCNPVNLLGLTCEETNLGIWTPAGRVQVNNSDLTPLQRAANECSSCSQGCRYAGDYDDCYITNCDTCPARGTTGGTAITGGGDPDPEGPEQIDLGEPGIVGGTTTDDLYCNQPSQEGRTADIPCGSETCDGNGGTASCGNNGWILNCSDGSVCDQGEQANSNICPPGSRNECVGKPSGCIFTAPAGNDGFDSTWLCSIRDDGICNAGIAQQSARDNPRCEDF